MKSISLLVAVSAVFVSGCSPDGAKEPAAAPAGEKHGSVLHNVHQPCDGIWTGSEPAGIAAFQELQRMGIKTIVSVDGAKPDLAAAEACGLRYIHLPHGYDGIPPETAAALAGLTKDQTGPLYLHCHHGKHRGPAAACIVAMGRKQLTPESAAKYLETAGTGKNYTGLWRDVAAFPSLPPDTKPAPLVPSAPVNGLVESMTQLDRAFDSLSAAKEPDAATALLVQEGFTESLRHLPADAPAELRQMMEASLKQATTLRDQPAAAPDILPVLKKQCSECHRKFRDS